MTRFFLQLLLFIFFCSPAFADPVTLTVAVGTVAAYAGAAAVGFGVTGAIVAATIMVGFSFAATRIFPPKAPKYDFASSVQGVQVQTRTATEPHKIIYGTTRVAGNISLIVTTNTSSGSSRTSENAFLHMMICFAGHEVEEFTTFFFNDDQITLDSSGFVTSAPYYKDGNSYARILTHSGAADQEADAVAIANIPEWDSTCKGCGIAYAYVILEANSEIYVQGVPNITCVIKGKKVYDPRTDTTYWSSNPVLCIRDYLSSAYGFSVSDDSINDTVSIASANVCDESVAKADGGSHARFTCDGFLPTDTSPIDNLQALTTSVLAPVVYSGGKFEIKVAHYESPVFDITDDMLAGPVSVTARPSRKNLFNAVKGVYLEPSKNYSTTSLPVVTNSVYEEQDGGQRIEKEFDFPFLQDSERGQRMMKIILEKARQGISVVFPLNYSGMQVKIWDVVTRTDSFLGWSAKELRVMGWAFDNERGVTINAQEESAGSYAWNSGEATIVDPSPDTNLPSPFVVNNPGSPTIAESLYATINGSSIKSKALVSWGASDSAFAVTYQLEYKITTDAEYIVIPRTAATSYTIFDIQPGVYNFRVKAVNSLGVASPYAENTQQIFGLTALPLDIQNFSLNAINNNAHLSWDRVTDTDLDVIVGGSIRIRYTPDIVTPSWSSAIDIAPALPGSATQAVAPLLAGVYMAKAVDSSGNESATAASIVSTIANIVKMNAIATLNEAPSFAGSLTSMIVDSGVLRIDGTALFDDAAGLFDDAGGDFDGAAGAGFATSAEYGFSTYIDVGRVTTSRVTAGIAALIYDSTNTFDGRGGLFDDSSGMFDGDEITGVAVDFYVRTTDDDPAGSPVWSSWRKFFVGDYTCRAYQFKIVVSSSNPAYNIDISALSASVDCPDIDDAGTLTTSASGRTSVAFNKTFVITTPLVGGTILNASSGDYFDIPLANISSTGFEIGVKNSGGSYVARSVKWEAKGY